MENYLDCLKDPILNICIQQKQLPKWIQTFITVSPLGMKIRILGQSSQVVGNSLHFQKQRRNDANTDQLQLSTVLMPLKPLGSTWHGQTGKREQHAGNTRKGKQCIHSWAMCYITSKEIKVQVHSPLKNPQCTLVDNCSTEPSLSAPPYRNRQCLLTDTSHAALYRLKTTFRALPVSSGH